MIKSSLGYEDKNFIGLKNRNWTAMLVTQFNLFDAGNTEAKIKQAELSEQICQEQRQELEILISLEISDAYFSLKDAEKRINSNKIAEEEAISNFDIAQKAYSAGIGTNLDVMDAEVSLSQAKTNYINALYDYNISKAELEKAIGKNSN